MNFIRANVDVLTTVAAFLPRNVHSEVIDKRCDLMNLYDLAVTVSTHDFVSVVDQSSTITQLVALLTASWHDP